ncbi:MAG: hypothetical protein GY810_09750 [Aureispira sp.]|nr:hypothetical protein [Aureispira sp.]
MTTFRFFIVCLIFSFVLSNNTNLHAQNDSPETSSITNSQNKYFVKIPTIPVDDKKDSEQYMQEAISHFDGGRFDKCITLLNTAIETNEYGQLTDILFYYRAVAKTKLELYNEARLDYNRAIETNPSKAAYYYQRALVSFNLGEFGVSEKDFLKSIELGRTDARIYLKLGFIKEQLKDIRTAIAYYNKAIEKNTKYAEAYYYRGLVMFQVMMPQKGCEDFQKASDLGLSVADKKLQQYCNK